MSPERLTIIGGTHFGDPSGSQVTPSAPKATLGVPQGTLWAPHGAQIDLKSMSPGSQSDLPGDAKSPSGCTMGPLGVAAAGAVVVILLLRLLF